ncbi:MAG: hypothetical protein ACK40X_12310 [Armatimonadota bacterium]
MLSAFLTLTVYFGCHCSDIRFLRKDRSGYVVRGNEINERW